MELEVFDAFRSAGVPDDKARAAVESINRAIDRRYALHAEQLVTRGDLRAEGATLREEMAALRAEVATLREEMADRIAGVRSDLERTRGELLTRIAETKTEVIQWCVGSVFASVGMFAGITRLLSH
jgi:hypothetical protein